MFLKICWKRGESWRRFEPRYFPLDPDNCDIWPDKLHGVDDFVVTRPCLKPLLGRHLLSDRPRCSEAVAELPCSLRAWAPWDELLQAVQTQGYDLRLDGGWHKENVCNLEQPAPSTFATLHRSWYEDQS